MQLQSKQDISISLTTMPDSESASKLAEKLLAEGLAACVSLLDGVNSIYTWQDKLEKSSEVILIIKSKTSLTKELANRIAELHDYETPEFLSIKAELASEKYAEWLKAVTKD